ncbi:MAG: twin-arginine translocase TatA/TatE family subunit [Longimicrobiales bacterium]
MGIGGLGMWEMILIFMVVLLLFGARRLPEIGSALGKGIREFKGSIREIEHELKVPDEPKHRSTPPHGQQSGEPRKLSGGTPQAASGGAGEAESPEKEKQEAQ